MFRIVSYLFLVSMGIVGCGALSQTEKEEHARQVWKKQTFWGEVTIRQHRDIRGTCSFREITLRRRAGLFFDGRPTYVQATDYFCDDRFERWTFRSDDEAYRVDKRELTDLLLYLMHSLLPIEENVLQQQ